MAELERNLNKQVSTSDASRARKRKLKRLGETGSSNPSETGSHKRRSERRTSSKSEPSVRERLVASNVKIPDVSLTSLPEKLSSKLGLDSHQSTNGQSIRKESSVRNSSAPRSPHRKAESRRSDGIHMSAQHTQTQRLGNTEGEFLPRKNRRVYDARAEAPPPVMVRGGMGGMAFGRVASSRLRKQKTPKRRIDVPLHVTGAEVRLPSLPFIHLGWRAFSLLMVLMMLASLFLIWKAPVFQVNNVETEGLQRLTVTDLNAVMGIFGKSVFTINPGLLDASLQQAFPEFSKISVKLNLPANVKVVVTEREPVISWVQDGSESWVDAEGVSFPPRGSPTNQLVKVEGHGIPPGSTPGIMPATPQVDPLSLPEGTPLAITTIIPSMRLSPELVSSIVALGAKMPADTLLVYDSVHGLGWNDPAGWEVYFGSEDQDMEMKLTVYQALVERLQSEGIQPALISVEFVHAPYYRMER
ncbi:MAG: hypothetical protein A2Z71_09870 [Chloroflexi bacterium RBG_13_50_21]|nr:MAG: hypothetical protein A2Z71_09870 [Chloroflexi bacterium RBG_13_50_21]